MSLVELENIRQKGEALAASGDIEGAIELYKLAGDMGEPGANLRLAGHYADVELYDMVLFYANRVVLFYNTLKDEAPLRTVLYGIQYDGAGALQDEPLGRVVERHQHVYKA